MFLEEHYYSSSKAEVEAIDRFERDITEIVSLVWHFLKKYSVIYFRTIFFLFSFHDLRASRTCVVLLSLVLLIIGMYRRKERRDTNL